jgi:hypothetical protein
MVNCVEKIIGSAEKSRVGREPEPQGFFLRLNIININFDVLYPTCTTLFFSGFLTWLKMDLRSAHCTITLQVPPKRWKCPFSVPKI